MTSESHASRHHKLDYSVFIIILMVISFHKCLWYQPTGHKSMKTPKIQLSTDHSKIIARHWLCRDKYANEAWLLMTEHFL